MSGPSFLNLLKVQAPNIMNNTQQSKLIAEIHEAWATAHGYRKKLQAPSCKPEDLHAENTNQFVKAASRQAPSNKRQASSAKHK
jgi:DNA-binding protein H-NS